MSKTIQLQHTHPDGADINVILRGDRIEFEGHSYRLSNMDLTRLLMFCEDNIRRIGYANTDQRKKVMK